jgi:hypothetical protein
MEIEIAQQVFVKLSAKLFMRICLPILQLLYVYKWTGLFQQALYRNENANTNGSFKPSNYSA